MENSKFVNLYVYTTVDTDGKETYSYPFSAIDDDSAVRMIAHILAYAKFFQNGSYSLCHLYRIGSLEYVSSFTVSRSTSNDLFLLFDHDEVSFDKDVYQRHFDFYFSYISKFDDNKSEEKSNA